MEAMQIVAPTFLQQIFVAGVEDLGCSNTFFGTATVQNMLQAKPAISNVL